MRKEVMIVTGAGQIGMAIARRLYIPGRRRRDSKLLLRPSAAG